MHLVISAPSGYNTRELLLPLRDHLERDADITRVTVITPAAEHRATLFSNFSSKFSFVPDRPSVEEYTRLWNEITPSAILTPTIGLDPKDTLILRAANQANISTCTFIASWDNVFKIERLLTRGHSGHTKHVGGDYELPHSVAFWNNLNRDHWLRLFPDFAPEHLTVTGPPRFDYFTHADRIPSREQLFTYLGLTDNPATAKLIHAATTELYPLDYVVRAIHKAKLTQPVALYASVHPGGNIAKHESLKQYGTKVRYSFGRRDPARHPDFAYLPTDEEIYYLVALFKHTDVLVNHSSTVAIESMVANVPIINVKYGKPFDWFTWYRSMVYRDFQQHYHYITDEGATTIVHNQRQLITALNQYLDHPERHQAERAKTAQKLLTYTNGSSSKRLLDFIKRSTNRQAR